MHLWMMFSARVFQFWSYRQGGDGGNDDEIGYS